MFLSKNNANYPSKSPIKKTHPSKLPWISINANSGIKDDPKSYAKLRIKNGATLLQENIKIEIRGSTSQSFKKKSFSFLFLDENNNPKKVRPIGLPEHEHWVLYGPYADKSLSRNVLAYSLWGKMGYYAPKTKFCELSINGAYQGVYVLCEKIRVDSERLDLKNGYLLKIDRPKGAFFKSTITNDGVPNTVFEIKYPDITEISISEKNAVENFIHLFEEALFLSNPSSLDVFEIIDMNSFIDFLIINELCKNIDAYRLSTYFQITENKKVVMGPVWDFNFSLGLTNYLDGHKTDGFVFESMNEIPFWWKKLLQNIYFKKALKNRWNELRMGVLSDSTISNTLTIYADELVGAQKNNFEKWNLLDQKEVWPNYYIGGSHQDEVNYINTWILNRAKWLDNLWKN